jgi:hypothetical protein
MRRGELTLGHGSVVRGRPGVVAGVDPHGTSPDSPDEGEPCSVALWAAKSSGEGQSESHSAHGKAGADRWVRPIGRTGPSAVRELHRVTQDAT